MRKFKFPPFFMPCVNWPIRLNHTWFSMHPRKIRKFCDTHIQFKPIQLLQSNTSLSIYNKEGYQEIYLFTIDNFLLHEYSVYVTEFTPHAHESREVGHSYNDYEQKNSNTTTTHQHDYWLGYSFETGHNILISQFVNVT